MRWIAPDPNHVHVQLSETTLDWALAHLETEDTFMLPRAFEFDAIRHNWQDVRQYLSSENLVSWNPRPRRTLLAPKTATSFRFVTQLDPLEAIVFAGLVHDIGAELEATRVEESEEKVFSWRFSPDSNGRLYNPGSGWEDFSAKAREHAESGTFSWVVLADIVDFFPRLYLHPIERALGSATNRSDKAWCVLRLLRNWNAFVSYGIPVGPSAARLIAEVTISDVDIALSGDRKTFCRYSDDFRIFATSEAEARASLAELARVLFENHGLTLHPTKTKVVRTDEYLRRFERSGRRAELEGVRQEFFRLLEVAGIDNPSGDLEYNDLEEETRNEIDALNLEEMLEENLADNELEPVTTRFLLRRFGQLNIDLLDDVLAEIGKFAHLMDSVARYIRELRDLAPERSEEIGERVLDAIENNESLQLEYQRLWLLSIFTSGSEFNHQTRFQSLLSRWPDLATQRELMLAMGRANQAHWVRSRRRTASDLAPWVRRAFYAGASCLDPEELIHYYRSLRGGADILERSVIKWAQAIPFAP